MSTSPSEILQHIRQEADYLLSESRTIARDDFVKDETLKRAFVRSIEIIGEAVKRLPDDLKLKYPTIEWRAIAGMRDRLIHGYFSVDYEIVWDAVTNKVSELRDAVEQMLQDESPSESDAS